ncbi:Cytochrome B561 (fragment) [Burkholderia sp. 8Y]
MPITGWADASSRGWFVRLFGLMYYPLIAPRDVVLKEALSEAHCCLAWALLALFILLVACRRRRRSLARSDALRRMF